LLRFKNINFEHIPKSLIPSESGFFLIADCGILNRFFNPQSAFTNPQS